MDHPVRHLARQLVALRRRMVGVEIAMVTSVSPLQVDGGVTLKTLGWYVPRYGDAVLVIRRADAAYAIGALTPNEDVMPPTLLTVQTVSPQTATVAALDGRTWTLPYVGGAPGSGQQVAVLWQRRGPLTFEGVIIGPCAQPPLVTVATTPLPLLNQSVLPPDLAALPNPLVLSAVEMASWRGGAWRTDTTAAYQGIGATGQSNAGVFWYGSASRSGLTIESAEVYQRRLVGVGGDAAVTARWYRHTQTARGSTLPALTDPFNGLAQAPDASGWAPIPVSVAQAIATNGGGLAISSTSAADFCALAPRDSVDPDRRDPQSGAIRMTWRPNA